MSARAVVAAILLAVGAFASATAVVRGRERVPAERVTAPAEQLAPAGERIRLQVLNATSTRGLARRATLYLRDLGYDVVEIGNAGTERDSTAVIDRSAEGRAELADRIAAALGGAVIEHRPDSSRYLDVTVVLGATWRPPAEPFYP